jgi:hypothetical protein
MRIEETIKRRFFLGVALALLFILLGIITTQAQTKSEVYDYILASDIYERQIVFSQVLKETGHLKCTQCSLRKNNLFGFRYNHKYLEFDTWQQSIDYYERWQIRKGYTTDQDYYDFLARKWGAPNMETKYIPRLKLTK